MNTLQWRKMLRFEPAVTVTQHRRPDKHHHIHNKGHAEQEREYRYVHANADEVVKQTKKKKKRKQKRKREKERASNALSSSAEVVQNSVVQSAPIVNISSSWNDVLTVHDAEHDWKLGLPAQPNTQAHTNTDKVGSKALSSTLLWDEHKNTSETPVPVSLSATANAVMHHPDSDVKVAYKAPVLTDECLFMRTASFEEINQQWLRTRRDHTKEYRRKFKTAKRKKGKRS